MERRWRLGAVTAVVLAIATALTVAASSRSSRWEVALHLSAAGIELSATSQHTRIALTL
jgi:hypothetical protein